MLSAGFVLKAGFDVVIVLIKIFKSIILFQGNKPDFHHAMPGDKSKEFYENFLQTLKDAYKPDKVKGT